MYRAVAVAAALVLLASCGSDRATAPPASSSSQATTSTTTSTTTTTTTTTTAPPATVPLSPAPSPSDAAATFVKAWRNGNRLLAATVAVEAAVDAAFGVGDPGSVQDRGCNQPPQPPVLCVFRTDAGELQLRIRPEGDGWIVDQARVSPA